MVLLFSGITISYSSSGDLSLPTSIPANTSAASPTPTKQELSGAIGLHDIEGDNTKLLSRTEVPTPRSDVVEENLDPDGIEETCLERKLSHRGDEVTREISLGTKPGTTEEPSLLEVKEAALQKALTEVAKLKLQNCALVESITTTRNTASDAQDHVLRLKGTLDKAKESFKTLRTLFEKRNAELGEAISYLEDNKAELTETKAELARVKVELEDDEILLVDQKKECQTEYDKMRALARDIWIRMSDLEVVLAEEHGEMLEDEDGELQKYGFLKERARLHLDIPCVHMDVLADLAERIGTEGLPNGEDRITEEISEEEEAMIERFTLVDDRKALVLWSKPQFPLSKPSDKCLVVETSSTSNSEQALESDIQMLPVRDSSSSSGDHDSELPDDKSSASSDEQEEEGNPAKATKARSSIDLAATHFETPPLDTDDVNNIEGLPMRQLEQSFPGAAEQISQPNSPEASSEQDIEEGKAQNAQPGPIFGAQYGTPSQSADPSTFQAPSSVGGLFADTDKDFHVGMKPKMTKAQKREAAMKRAAEATEKEKAEQEAQAANQKKWKKAKKGLKK